MYTRLATGNRWFYFPGFTTATGGLLRETGLEAARSAFRRDAARRQALWHSLDVQPAESTLRISLFCYANPALHALLDVWAEGDEEVVCVVPEGVAQSELDRWTGGAIPHPGMPVVRGRLTLAVAKFVAQDAFDHRLWACDLNFVRGEDSLVRALWAMQPLVWHIYPQAEDVHLLKLDALLARYKGDMDADAASAQRAFWRAWNRGDPVATTAAWPSFRTALPRLKTRGSEWAQALARQTDLAKGLVTFCENRL